MSETGPELTDAVILSELAPTAEALLNRHIKESIVWYPDEFIPYDDAKSFKPGYVFDPEESDISEAAAAALFVNLLTEDNLTAYFATINRTLGNNSPYPEWSQRWAAEEFRHSLVIRGVIVAKRLIDYKRLEDARFAHMWHSETPQPPNAAELLVYAKMQEKATQISHRNTGKATASQLVNKALGPVSRDEGFHHDFYGDLSIAGFKIFPSQFMIAAYNQVRHFAMPGADIPGFKEMAEKIAQAGIYNLEIFKDEIVEPNIEAWGIEDLEGLNDEAEIARDNLLGYPARLDKIIARGNKRDS